jgi:protein-tyrosine-phosphatase
VPDQRPSVLFVCVHNAGRSQMAAAYATHLSGGRVQVLSAGSAAASPTCSTSSSQPPAPLLQLAVVRR